MFYMEHVNIYICTCPIGRYSKSKELTGSSSSAGFLDMWPWRRFQVAKPLKNQKHPMRIVGGLLDYWKDYISADPSHLQGERAREKVALRRHERAGINECQHHVHQAFLAIFFWLQKATLGSRLALNVSRRPRLPLNPSRRPWRPSSMSFGHLPGAFLEFFPSGFRKQR